MISSLPVHLIVVVRVHFYSIWYFGNRADRTPRIVEFFHLNLVAISGVEYGFLCDFLKQITVKLIPNITQIPCNHQIKQ